MRFKFAITLLATATMFACVGNALAQTRLLENPGQFRRAPTAETEQQRSSRVQFSPSSRRQRSIFFAAETAPLRPRPAEATVMSTIAVDAIADNPIADNPIAINAIAVSAIAVNADLGKTVATRIPDRDSSTSPHRMVPKVDKAAFETNSNFTTSPTARSAKGSARDDAVEPSSFYKSALQDSAIVPQVAKKLEPVRSQQGMVGEPIVSVAPAYTSEPERFSVQYEGCQSNCRPSSTNFFGISEDQCCDEWNEFSPSRPFDYDCNCGGLKAIPGHYGQKWLQGKDPCETAGRCRCKSCQRCKK